MLRPPDSPSWSSGCILAKNSSFELMSSMYLTLIPVAFSKFGIVSLSM